MCCTNSHLNYILTYLWELIKCLWSALKFSGDKRVCVEPRHVSFTLSSALGWGNWQSQMDTTFLCGNPSGSSQLAPVWLLQWCSAGWQVALGVGQTHVDIHMALCTRAHLRVCTSLHKQVWQGEMLDKNSNCHTGVCSCDYCSNCGSGIGGAIMDSWM